MKPACVSGWPVNSNTQVGLLHQKLVDKYPDEWWVVAIWAKPCESRPSQLPQQPVSWHHSHQFLSDYLYKYKQQRSLKPSNSKELSCHKLQQALYINQTLQSRHGYYTCAIDDCQCQATSQTSDQKPVGCSQRPHCSLCGRGPKKEVCGSNICPEPSFIPKPA